MPSNNELLFKDLLNIFHYWTMKGSKFLLTYELNQIIKNIFFFEPKPETTEKKDIPIENENNKNNMKTQNSNLFNEKVSTEKIRQLERMQSNKAKTPITTIKFVINVDNPQININYQLQNSQMLLHSKKDCLIVCYEKHLPFDKFRMDLKKYLHFYFSNMEAFTAPTNIDINNQIFWLTPEFTDTLKSKRKDLDEDYELREGLLNRIAVCNFFSITISFFKLPECEIDFSNNQLEKCSKSEKRYIWGDEPRMRNVRINVGKLLSFMDSKSYYNFRNVMDLFAIMVSSDEKIKEIEKENKDLLAELKKFSSQAVLTNIQERVSDMGLLSVHYRSNFEYFIDMGEFCMIKGESPFLKIKIEKFNGSHLYYEDESSTYQLVIKKLDMKNLLEPIDKEYNNIMSNINSEGSNKEISSELDETPMIMLKMHYNLVNGLMVNNKWKVFEQYEIKIVPLIIRMTEEIYNYYYEYIFSNEQNEILEKEKEGNKFKNKGNLNTKKNNIEVKKKVSFTINYFFEIFIRVFKKIIIYVF